MKTEQTIVLSGETTDGQPARLIFQLGGIPEKEMAKLREEVDKLNKSNTASKCYRDNLKSSASHLALAPQSSNEKVVTVIARRSDASLRRCNNIASNNYKKFAR